MDEKKLHSMLERVKKEIRPDSSVIQKVDKIVGKINDSIKKMRLDAMCVKGGSVAKETFLKGNHDADLFMRFSLDFRGKDISGLTEQVLWKAGFEAARIHGSRDYFQFIEGKVDYEVIPVLMIHPTNYADAENVTDLSPAHVDWVRKHTSKNPALPDEIRLAKQFCKAAGVYGAESYINGFSGHIIDILIIYYGSFMSFIEAFSKVKNYPVIIDVEHHLKDALSELNKSKISSLIVVDPIQVDRNAAAALSKEKLDMFIDACRRFLKEPSMKFFEIEKFDLDKRFDHDVKAIRSDAKSKGKAPLIGVILSIKTLEGSKDIVGTKVLKAYEDLIRHSGLCGFDVLASSWDFDFAKRSAVMYMIFEDAPLSDNIEHVGPPLSAKEDAKRFHDKHPDAYTRAGRLYAAVPRQHILPQDCIKDLITKDFIRSRVSSIKIIEIRRKK